MGPLHCSVYMYVFIFGRDCLLPRKYFQGDLRERLVGLAKWTQAVSVVAGRRHDMRQASRSERSLDWYKAINSRLYPRIVTQVSKS